MNTVPFQTFISQPNLLKETTRFLLLGSDAFLVDKAYLHIREYTQKRFHHSVELITLYGDEVSPAELGDYLDGYSIFSAHRLIVIRNGASLEKKDFVIIENYLQHPDKEQILVVIADAVDARLAGWKAVREHCLTVECEAPKSVGEMRAWLDQQLGEAGKSMETNAKQAFLQKVELDFSTACNELEKLFIYTSDKSIIKESDVQTTLATARAGTLTDFYKALGARELNKLLPQIEEMLADDWEPVQINANLFRFFHTLWRIQACRRKHLTDREISEHHLSDIFPSVRKYYFDYVAVYPYQELHSIFQLLLQLDSQLKLTAAEPAVLFDWYLTKICHA